jgi:hypothetical protein
MCEENAKVHFMYSDISQTFCINIHICMLIQTVQNPASSKTAGFSSTQPLYPFLQKNVI